MPPLEDWWSGSVPSDGENEMHDQHHDSISSVGVSVGEGPDERD